MTKQPSIEQLEQFLQDHHAYDDATAFYADLMAAAPQADPAFQDALLKRLLAERNQEPMNTQANGNLHAPPLPLPQRRYPQGEVSSGQRRYLPLTLVAAVLVVLLAGAMLLWLGGNDDDPSPIIPANPSDEEAPNPAQQGSSATAPPQLPSATALPSATTLPPTHVPVVSATPIGSNAQACPFYQVQPGDTLASIAAQFGVEPGALLMAAGLRDESALVPGQLLMIPQDGCVILAAPPQGDFQATVLPPLVTATPSPVPSLPPGHSLCSPIGMEAVVIAASNIQADTPIEAAQVLLACYPYSLALPPNTAQALEEVIGHRSAQDIPQWAFVPNLTQESSTMRLHFVGAGEGESLFREVETLLQSVSLTEGAAVQIVLMADGEDSPALTLSASLITWQQAATGTTLFFLLPDAQFRDLDALFSDTDAAFHAEISLR